MNTVNFWDLCPGDIMLCKGEGWISDMIVLFDGGPYSHSALYVGIINGEHSVIQATGSGIKCSPLKMLEEETYTDVFRFNKNNHKLGSDGYPFEPINQVANSYVTAGTKYAYDHLLILAILAATRDIPLDPTAKKLLRIVLDNATAFIFKLLDQGKTPMVCSELVYRCFDEADSGKKYQFAVSSLKMTEILQTVNTTISNPTNDGKTDVDLLNAKKNFMEALNKTKEVENEISSLSNNPVAACVSPSDIKNSGDLYRIGRLNYQ